MTLFSFDFSEQAIQPGDIVRQAWPWILCDRGNSLMPFWQVRSIHMGTNGRRLYGCMPVPYTTGQGDIHMFEEHDLERTGKSWRVPTNHEVEMWFRDLGTTMFTARLNGVSPETTHPDEAELVALVESLGPIKLPYNRSQWYAHFPHPTPEERRARARAAQS